MLLTIFLPALESIINRALKSDPDALAKIATLKNQVIEIQCDDWNMHFYIAPSSQGLLFYSKKPGKITTQIKGTLNNFLHIFIKGATTATLFQHPIDIDGNTHAVEVIRDAFKNIDLDLEEKLSHFIGDTLAHKLFSRAKSIKKTLEETGERLIDQTKEYIHFETKSFISHKQAEQFYADVAKLRDDVDRMSITVETRFIASQKEGNT